MKTKSLRFERLSRIARTYLTNPDNALDPERLSAPVRFFFCFFAFLQKIFYFCRSLKSAFWGLPMSGKRANWHKDILESVWLYSCCRDVGSFSNYHKKKLVVDARMCGLLICDNGFFPTTSVTDKVSPFFLFVKN